MSDYERYGDYDDREEDEPRSKSPVLLTLKIITAILCVGVIALIAFRMISFNKYPDSVKNLYFNDILTEHYNEKDGNISVKTQTLRAPYDDKDLGNFFCDYLYLIDDIDQLQITLRYNKSTIDRLSAELKTELDDMDPDLFNFSLVACYGKLDPNGPDKEENWNLVRYDAAESVAFDSQLMYRYHKIVFDGVDYNIDTEGAAPYWIRLEVSLKGYDNGKVYNVCIYENNDILHEFRDYKLGKEDIPS